ILSDRFEKQSNSVYGENVIKEFILLLEKIVGDKLPFIEIPDSSCIIKFIQDHHDTEKYQAWLDDLEKIKPTIASYLPGVKSSMKFEFDNLIPPTLDPSHFVAFCTAKRVLRPDSYCLMPVGWGCSEEGMFLVFPKVNENFQRVPPYSNQDIKQLQALQDHSRVYPQNCLEFCPVSIFERGFDGVQESCLRFVVLFGLEPTDVLSSKKKLPTKLKYFRGKMESNFLKQKGYYKKRLKTLCSIKSEICERKRKNYAESIEVFKRDKQSIREYFIQSRKHQNMKTIHRHVRIEHDAVSQKVDETMRVDCIQKVVNKLELITEQKQREISRIRQDTDQIHDQLDSSKDQVDKCKDCIENGKKESELMDQRIEDGATIIEDMKKKIDEQKGKLKVEEASLSSLSTNRPLYWCSIPLTSSLSFSKHPVPPEMHRIFATLFQKSDLRRRSGQGRDEDKSLPAYTKLQFIRAEFIVSQVLFDGYKAERSEWKRIVTSCADTAVDRVQLEPQTLEFNQSMKAQIGIKLDENELLLFHGTNRCHIDSILSKGFNERIGRPDRRMCGMASYFSDHPAKADQYSRTETPGTRECAMIVSRCFLGPKVHSLSSPTELSQAAKGTVVPGSSDPNCYYRGAYLDRHRHSSWWYSEFAIFEGRLCYPEFIVYYRRC
ncbi:hypothetical protein ADUPG1_006069, partial [Aduncisulcus paluster]